MPKKVTLKRKRGAKRSPKNVMKNMEKLSPKNMEQFASSRMNQLTINLFSKIIAIIFIYGIIKYLKELQNCECLGDKQKNIQTLLYIEYLFIALNIIGLIGIISSMLMPRQTGGAGFMYAVMAYTLLYLIVMGLLVYNAFKLFEGINDKCECSVSSLRYLLYIQVFIAIIAIFSMIMGIIGLMTLMR
jgi:hypothetical protein